MEGRNESWRQKSGSHWRMDSISSHRTGMIAVLDYVEYIPGEETVAKDSAG